MVDDSDFGRILKRLNEIEKRLDSLENKKDDSSKKIFTPRIKIGSNEVLDKETMRS